MITTELLKQWSEAKKLVKEGYGILDKEMTMGIPGPCMPATDNDVGIGTPYGKGAERLIDFFSGCIDKLLLGPSGKVFPPFYSPYESAFGENPFFIVFDEWRGKLIDSKTIDMLGADDINDTDINFPLVNRKYNLAIKKCYQTYQKKLNANDAFALKLEKQIKAFVKTQPSLEIDAKFFAQFEPERYIFESFLAYYAALKAPKKIATIADLQVKIPGPIEVSMPHLFLKNFTLGAPPDQFSNTIQDWNFKVFNPDFIFNPDGSLGEAGQILFKTFDTLFKTHKGGVRIDHFIGFVNPYMVSRKREFENGRLYSSYHHPELKKYAKHSDEEFANITEKIILAAMEKNKATPMDIYPEDLGTRPEQLDAVMAKCGLGRMLVAQFGEIDNPKHQYLLRNARFEDVATLDTHDTMSVQSFFAGMTDDMRFRYAKMLSEDLRFVFNPSLADTRSLLRMQWGDLLACPAKRVQAFFTSFIGQAGRYNAPDNPKKWRLRCTKNFEELYFTNLKYGRSYNPLDAIALAIYARGEEFFGKNKSFVDALRRQEEKLFAEIDNAIQ